MDKAEFVEFAKYWAKENLIEYDDEYIAELIEDLLHTEGEEEVLSENAIMIDYKLTFVLELMPFETKDEKLHSLIFSVFGFGVKSNGSLGDSDYELLDFVDMDYKIVSQTATEV